MVIVLTFLAILGMTFVVYSLFTTENYKRLRLEGIEKTVEFETEKVNKKIARIELGAAQIAISGMISKNMQSTAIGETLLIENLIAFPEAEGGGFWFEPYAYDKETHRHGIYAYFDAAAGSFVLDETMYSDGTLDIDYYDYHAMSWYREVFDAVSTQNQIVWTKPYIDDSGSLSLMTSAGAGMFDQNGDLIGTSIIDWKIEDVVKELTAIKPTDNSFVLLCVPEQNYIISNTFKDDEADFYYAGAGLGSLSWDIKADSFTLDGTTYMTFSRVMDNNWYLSVCIPENEIFAEAERQNNWFSRVIAFSAVLMLCIAFLLISALINRPLKRLINEISQIGLGNLDVNIDIKSKDELGVLAETFTKMTADLKASIDQNVKVMAEKEHIAAELRVATKIQASMLPCIFPAFPDHAEFDIFARMLPAEEVGGDFYDFFLIDDDTLAVIIADVSDKGIPAALFMVITKTLIKNNALSGKSPKEVFETVNNMLCENNEENMFVTAFLGYLDIPSGKLTFVNAGHNPPLLSAKGKYDWLKTKPGAVLAVMEDMFYKQHEVTLCPGDELFLYTDGVTEAANNEYDLFGETRLIGTVNDHLDLPLREFIITIQREIDKFTKGMEQSDDITMLALRYTGKLTVTNKLYIDARLENIEEVLSFVGERLKCCSPKIQNQIELAVDEIFSNISRYAYYPYVGGVTISIDVRSNDVVIEFTDSGVEYDPLSAEEPDITLPAEQRGVGGLGIFMVRNIMDSMVYRRNRGKNILTMKKRLE